MCRQHEHLNASRSPHARLHSPLMTILLCSQLVDGPALLGPWPHSAPVSDAWHGLTVGRVIQLRLERWQEDCCS